MTELTDSQFATVYGTGILLSTRELERKVGPPPPCQANKVIHFLGSFFIAFLILQGLQGIHEIGRAAIPRTTKLLVGSSRPLVAESEDDVGNSTRRSLLLLRHAKSSWDYPSLTDEQRPLSSHGVKEAKRLGLYLKEYGIQPPEIIIASPSARTRETLDLVRRQWAADIPVVYEAELYDLALSSYFDFIKQLDPALHRIMLVGHNPAIGALAWDLLSNSHHAKKYPTGTFLELEWDRALDWRYIAKGEAISRHFVPPKATQRSR